MPYKCPFACLPPREKFHFRNACSLEINKQRYIYKHTYISFLRPKNDNLSLYYNCKRTNEHIIPQPFDLTSAWRTIIVKSLSCLTPQYRFFCHANLSSYFSNRIWHLNYCVFCLVLKEMQFWILSCFMFVIICLINYLTVWFYFSLRMKVVCLG